MLSYNARWQRITLTVGQTDTNDISDLRLCICILYVYWQRRVWFSLLEQEEQFTWPHFYPSCTEMLNSSWTLLHDGALQTLQYFSVCQDWRPPEFTIFILTKKTSGKPWWQRCCRRSFLSVWQYDWRALGRTASHHWRSESFQIAETEHLKVDNILWGKSIFFAKL